MIGNGLGHAQMQNLWADGNDSGANWALSLFEELAGAVDAYLADPAADEVDELRAEMLLREFLLIWQKQKIYSLQRRLASSKVIGKDGEEMR